jgi:hypothetical protein
MVMSDIEANAADDQEAGEAARRGRSKIVFVYSDLQSAVELARVLQDRAGTNCEIKQLATWMNHSAEGGTFRSLLGAARTFGLVETQQGTVSLTSLGRDALDAARSPGALAEAFMRVPLHAAMYQQFSTYALPPAAAIERAMEGLGVPPKQKERARQTFTKSAQYAGYIDAQTGRFIKPAVAPSPPPPMEEDKSRRGGNGGGDGRDDGLNLDPLLMALLRKIPPAGQEWPADQRVRWFRTFAMNVSQIYDTDEPVDMTITLQGGTQK